MEEKEQKRVEMRVKRKCTISNGSHDKSNCTVSCDIEEEEEGGILKE